MKLLAISGSLREASTNTRLLRALALLAPSETSVAFYEALDDLPHFKPDLDVDPAPAAVALFREELRAADAVVISSPEYAHGVPGTLKNALDWVVSSGEFVEKPVALINASPRSLHAYESLAETLRTMAAVIVPEASITLPLLGNKLSAAQIVGDSLLAEALRGVATALIGHQHALG